MKVNTNDTGSSSKKGFAKYPFKSEKNPLMSERLKKSFSFSIDSPVFKKSVEVLAFYICVDSNFI